MNITTHTGLVGFLLVLSAFSIPVANAATSQPTANPSPSIERRLNRITAAIRQREAQRSAGESSGCCVEQAQLQDVAKPKDNMLMARGFADGGRGGWNQFARGGTATGVGGGSFNNFHPAYGGVGGWRDGGGFANGAYGGAGFVNGAYEGAGFRNGAYGGAGFVNGAYGGAGFANGAYRGAGFRNW